MAFAAQAMAGFAATKQLPVSALGRAAMSSVVTMGLFKSTAATVAASVIAKDYSSAAISYFESMRVPSALIAGSALASLFTLSEKTKDQRAASRTQLESIVLIIYHVLALSSLLLSLNVVVTATASANTIMFGRQDPIATSVLALLIREYEFEFQLSRLSFFIGLFSFLGTVATRALVEFELLKEQRRVSLMFVLSSFGSLFFHLLAFVNARLLCYKSIGEMTWAVLAMWLRRSLSGRSPSELASICCMISALGSTVALFLRSGMFSRNAKTAPVNDKN